MYSNLRKNVSQKLIIQFTYFLGEHAIGWWSALLAWWISPFWYQVSDNSSTLAGSFCHIFVNLCNSQNKSKLNHHPIDFIQKYREKITKLSWINSPALAGNARQLPWPCSSIYARSFWSSSGVHGPFFKPTFSQHGERPILFSLFPFYLYNLGCTVFFLKKVWGTECERGSRVRTRTCKRFKQFSGKKDWVCFCFMRGDGRVLDK